MSQSIDEILRGIKASVQSTDEAISELHSKIESPELPALVSDLLQKTNQPIPEGVSLLDLKNNAILSYLNNLVLIILARIENLKTNDSKDVDELKLKAVKNSIVQRVVMERGVKNLEKKLQYQLEKMIRNYNKMEKDSSEQTINKKLQDQEREAKDSNEDEEDSEEESDSEDELNYKPDASALVKSMQKDKKIKDSSSRTSDDKTEKYKPPKIAAALPPQEFKDTGKRTTNGKKKMQSMEEYLLETGDAPMVESSIGSTILNHGRGGVKTSKDREREAEIQRYEESNFTRLPNTISKKDKRQKRKQEADTFFGEDWGIFRNNKNDLNTSRNSKPKSAWDRAKKRRTD